MLNSLFIWVVFKVIKYKNICASIGKSNIDLDKEHVKEIVKGSFNEIFKSSKYTNASLNQFNLKI